MAEETGVVVEQYAEHLLKRAASALVGFAVAGAIGGAALGSAPGLLSHSVISPGANYFAVLLGAVAGGILGRRIGERRAVGLRLQAQMALRQLQLESRIVSAAALPVAPRVAAPAAPAPVPVAAPPAAPPAQAPALPPAPVAPLEPAPVASPPAPLLVPPAAPAEAPLRAADPLPASSPAPALSPAPPAIRLEAPAAVTLPPLSQASS